MKARKPASNRPLARSPSVRKRGFKFYRMLGHGSLSVEGWHGSLRVTPAMAAGVTDHVWLGFLFLLWLLGTALLWKFLGGLGPTVRWNSDDGLGHLVLRCQTQDVTDSPFKLNDPTTFPSFPPFLDVSLTVLEGSTTLTVLIWVRPGDCVHSGPAALRQAQG